MRNIFIIIVCSFISFSIFGQISSRNLSQNDQPNQTFIPKLDSSITSNYNKNTKQWNKSKSIYIYDVNNNLVSSDRYKWIKEKWKLTMQNEHVQDIDENKKTSYLWNKDKSLPFFTGIKEEIIYDTKGNIRQETTYVSVMNADWEGGMRNEYTYDADNNNKKEEIEYRWDTKNEQWKNSSKWIHFYDDNGKKIKSISYNWNGFENWNKKIKYEYIRDSNGRNIKTIYYKWIKKRVEPPYENMPKKPEGWINYIKYDYTYDNPNSDLQNIRYVWDADTQEWLFSYKHEYVYDNSYTGKDLIKPHFIDIKKKVMSHKGYIWDKNENQWVYDVMTTYYYSKQVTQKDTNPLTVTIYPNPSNNFVTFDIENTSASATVKLYDAQGKKVDTQELSADNTLSVSHLSSGVYFYQLHYEGQIQGGKIIVE